MQNKSVNGISSMLARVQINALKSPSNLSLFSLQTGYG